MNLLEDPKFKAFYDDITVLGKAMADLPLPEQRKLDAAFLRTHNTCHETIYRTENIHVPGSDSHSIPVRLYIPKQSNNLPVMVYFHGGGWVFGGINESDPVCCRLSNHLGCIVASVGYRLAPEYPFPIPLEDCYAAVQWMAANANRFGGDQGNVFVGGESAGGNLAAAAALMARDRKGPQVSAQLLLYPAISPVKDAVYASCPDKYFLTQDAMTYFWESYTQEAGADKHPYAALDCGSDFSNLPPAVIITAEYDPLCGKGHAYAALLQEAGVPVVEKEFPKLVHAFLYIHLYDEKRKVQWTKEIGDSLQELVSNSK